MVTNNNATTRAAKDVAAASFEKKEAPVAIRIKIIKKKKSAKRSRVGIQRRPSGFLPSIRRTATSIQSTISSALDNNKQDDEFDFGLDQELPSDTRMAIHSIQTSSQGLHIPLTLDGGRHVQAVLESQIYQTFEESHASTTFQEIRQLLSTNQLRQLPCRQKSNRMALLTTQDYSLAVWDAHESESRKSTSTGVNNDDKNDQVGLVEDDWKQEVVSWFLASLPQLTLAVIPKEQLQDAWKSRIRTIKSSGGSRSNIIAKSVFFTLENALSYLLTLQVLMKQASVNAHEESYHLWLPL
jgi:hypothetical protein